MHCISISLTEYALMAKIIFKDKASKNKHLVSYLCPHLFQGLKQYPCGIKLAGKRFSAFSQFLKHLSRSIRSELKLHLKLY